MLPLCRDQGIGVIPWSPLARGKLTRDWAASTNRAETDAFGKTLYNRNVEAEQAIVEAVRSIAEARGVSRAQVALAWHFAKPGITAPIVGATKPEHIADAVAAVELKLTTDEVAALEGPYVAQAIQGHS